MSQLELFEPSVMVDTGLGLIEPIRCVIDRHVTIDAESRGRQLKFEG